MVVLSACLVLQVVRELLGGDLSRDEAAVDLGVAEELPKIKRKIIRDNSIYMSQTSSCQRKNIFFRPCLVVVCPHDVGLVGPDQHKDLSKIKKT